MKINPRRPYDDFPEAFPNGYLESDRDYVMNNLEAAVALLDAAPSIPTYKDAKSGEWCQPPAHVCGLQGFDPTLGDDPCPACKPPAPVAWNSTTGEARMLTPVTDVYVVMFRPDHQNVFSEPWIVGVFSTREKARECAERPDVRPDPEDVGSDVVIYHYEVDSQVLG